MEKSNNSHVTAPTYALEETYVLPGRLYVLGHRLTEGWRDWEGELS